MELREYLRVLRRAWLLILVITIIGLAVAVGLTALTTKTYEATARDFVRVTVSSTSSNNLADESAFAQARVKSYVGLGDSDAVLRPVIADLNLQGTSVSNLADKISIENPVDTVLLDITASDSSARQAARLSNAVAGQLKTVIEGLEVPRSGTQSQVTVSVVRRAVTPTSATSPRPVLNYALGLVIGLALGVVVAIARERLDNGVRRIDDLTALTGNAPLGAVPFAEEVVGDPLVALHNRSPVAEAYRSIRTRIEFVDVDSPPRRIVVTSSVPGEGKSVSACNLAITLASTGLAVCLIEGDLRRPRVAGYLGFDAGVGLSDVLANRYWLDDVLVSWNDGLLTVLPAGTAPPDPSNLLSSQQMRDLLDELSERFDMIIIDAPPLLPVTDAAVLGAQVDGTVLMVRMGRTRRTEVSRSLGMLAQANVRVLGTVATFVSKKTDDYAASYGYGYLDEQDDVPVADEVADEVAADEPPAAKSDEPARDADEEYADEVLSAETQEADNSETVGSDRSGDAVESTPVRAH